MIKGTLDIQYDRPVMPGSKILEYYVQCFDYNCGFEGWVNLIGMRIKGKLFLCPWCEYRKILKKQLVIETYASNELI